MGSSATQSENLSSAQRVFDAADGVLHLASDLFGLAFRFELAVAGYFSRDLFHFACRSAWGHDAE